MKYKIFQTDVFEEQLSNKILYIAETYGKETGLNIFNEIKESISSLKDNPYLGVVPKYRTLKRQGYRVLISKKNMIFYKVDEENRTINLYVLFDSRQDYINIINGL